MALARVQTTGKVIGDNTTSIALTFATPPTVGNGIVVPLIIYGESGTPTCTDNRGNTYVQAVTQLNSPTRVRIYYCASIVASVAPFTITLAAGPTYWVGTAFEVSGVGSGLAVDRIASVSGSNSPGSTGTTAALTKADDLVVAVLSANAAQASLVVESVSPAWTQECEDLSFSHAVGESDFRTLTGGAGTTVSCSWTMASATQWCGAIAAFSASVPPSEARASQLVVETLSLPSPAARLTQLVAETLSSLSLTGTVDARVSQLVVETLSQTPPTGTGQVTFPVSALAGEGTVVNPIVVAHVSQIPVESAWNYATVPARISQAPVETAFTYGNVPARVSQAPVEVARAYAPVFLRLRVSQVAVEIIRPAGCYPGIVPPVPPIPGVDPITVPLQWATHRFDVKPRREDTG